MELEICGGQNVLCPLLVKKWVGHFPHPVVQDWYAHIVSFTDMPNIPRKRPNERDMQMLAAAMYDFDDRRVQYSVEMMEENKKIADKFAEDFLRFIIATNTFSPFKIGPKIERQGEYFNRIFQFQLGCPLTATMLLLSQELMNPNYFSNKWSQETVENWQELSLFRRSIFWSEWLPIDNRKVCKLFCFTGHLLQVACVHRPHISD